MGDSINKIMSNESTAVLPTTYLNLRDINIGIVLIGTYILFDFGAFQGVFEIVNQLRLPFIVALLSVIYVLYLIANNRIDFSGLTTKIFITLCFFIIIYAQISTINYSKQAILTLFLQYLANYLIIITCVKKPSQFILLINIWLFAVLHSCFRAIYSGGKLYDSIWLKDENHISLIAAYAIPFAFFLFMSYKSKLKKMFYVICLGFYTTAVVVSVSRGGLVAMISVAFLCWLFIKHKIRALLPIMLASVLIFIYAPAKFFEEAQTIHVGKQEGTAEERLYSWQIAAKMFIDYPIVGVGPMNYPEFFIEYDYENRFKFASAGRRAFQGRAAHSTPMQWLAEFGIIGSIILIILQIAMYRNWRTVYKNRINGVKMPEVDFNVLKYMTNACAISQVGFWVAALFLTLLVYPFYWCLIPFSEAWKNIFLEHVKEYNGKISK